jgi:hypothetical protein
MTGILAAATAPPLVAAVFRKDPRLAAGAFLCFAVICAFICLRALRDGVIVTRQEGPVERADSPVVYWLLVAVVSVAGLASFLVALLALLGYVSIHQQAPW